MDKKLFKMLVTETAAILNVHGQGKQFYFWKLYSWICHVRKHIITP